MQTEKFLQQMKNKGVSSFDLARCLGVTPVTVRHKIVTGAWTSEEAQKIQNVLHFPDPATIFFS